MSKLNKILFWVVAALVVVLVVLVVWQLFFSRGSYSAVYLRTGDLYFGRLTKFPSFGMKNVYTLQATGDEQNPVRVQKFGDVFWGPEDWLKINKNEVVWYTTLKSDGQMAQLFKTNPNLAPQQQGVAPQQQVPQQTAPQQ
ncbi:hypothetical protein A3I34_00535 [Candidatus Jorgensenbacteria bacterium RIFCSPLOWO2_02_FULL_45_12]|nr:MAG: hypothetical protein A3I34_00535 [Candidatus Jorgensenbacteria bacterium RIFCSPLOWO2_02_FULL_45_12]